MYNTYIWNRCKRSTAVRDSRGAEVQQAARAADEVQQAARAALRDLCVDTHVWTCAWTCVKRTHAHQRAHTPQKVARSEISDASLDSAVTSRNRLYTVRADMCMSLHVHMPMGMRTDMCSAFVRECQKTHRRR